MGTLMRSTACGTLLARLGTMLVLPASSIPTPRPRSRVRGVHLSTATSFGVRKLANPKPPHSLLPTKVLLRSFLVATVSSHRILLGPCLMALNFLSKSRLALFNIEKNPVLFYIFKTTLYNHFCAGENEREVSSTIRGIKDMGFRGVILTYAKEVIFDKSTEDEIGIGVEQVKGRGTAESAVEVGSDQGIEGWRQGVLQTVSMLGESDFLALK